MSPLRKLIFSIHKWLGLNLVLFFGFMFLTGSLLTLAGEVEKLLHPDIRTEARNMETGASFGEIYDAIAAHQPDGTPHVIVMQPIQGAGDRTNVNLQTGQRMLFWTDPADASVLEITSARNFKNIVHELHDSLLVPSRVAFLVVSGTSLFLLYSVVSGLITYRRFWRGWFRFPKRDMPSRAKWAAWHRLLGLWLTPFLLIMGVTSFYFFLGGLNLTGKVPQPPLTETRETVRGPNFNGDLIDQAHSAVVEAYPWLLATTAVLPANERQGIRFGGPHRDGGLTLYTASVNPDTLEVVGIASTQDAGPLTDIKQLMNALHYGTWGGTAVRYLWVALGVVTAGLLWAGAAVYFARTNPAHSTANGARAFWQGLGILRWGYLAALAGIGAMVVLRFIL